MCIRDRGTNHYTIPSPIPEGLLTGYEPSAPGLARFLAFALLQARDFRRARLAARNTRIARSSAFDAFATSDRAQGAPALR